MSDRERLNYEDSSPNKANSILGGGGGGKPPTHSKILKRPILNILSNAELVQHGISKGFIQNGDSAKDLVEVYKSYDKDLGNFMMQIVKYNIASKRGRSGKAFSATGEVDGVYYKNPREYLQKIKEKVIDSTSEFDVLKTTFGVIQETKAELVSTFTNNPKKHQNYVHDYDNALLAKEGISGNTKKDIALMFLGGDVKEKKITKFTKNIKKK